MLFINLKETSSIGRKMKQKLNSKRCELNIKEGLSLIIYSNNSHSFNSLKQFNINQYYGMKFHS